MSDFVSLRSEMQQITFDCNGRRREHPGGPDDTSNELESYSRSASLNFDASSPSDSVDLCNEEELRNERAAITVSPLSLLFCS